ncbi:MAG: pyroglutamyl-peptidase I [Enhydrobacter sp.]|nr:MAG: pyroglutamyl-peptidase I [Enhydrobacter sp.]
MKALVTGFEPFGGDEINPSWEAVRLLGDRIGSLAVHTVRLPTSFGRSTSALRERIDELRPDLVLCVGLAGGRAELCLERVAINVQDARIPDNDGDQPIDVPVVANGPAAHFATLPIKACVAEMRRARLAATVSNTAGTFVCNHIFYALMDFAVAAPWPLRGGFLHVPHAPGQATGPTMELADIARGIEIILTVSAARTDDVRSAEGRIA